jgi:hypothetical protein
MAAHVLSITLARPIVVGGRNARSAARGRESDCDEA